MNKSEYYQYLASREWALLKEAVKGRSGSRCERCRVKDSSAVHHLTYERVGNENLDDLIDLCRDCHRFLSGKQNEDMLAAKLEIMKRTFQRLSKMQRKADLACQEVIGFLGHSSDESEWEDYRESLRNQFHDCLDFLSSVIEVDEENLKIGGVNG